METTDKLKLMESKLNKTDTDIDSLLSTVIKADEPLKYNYTYEDIRSQEIGSMFLFIINGYMNQTIPVSNDAFIKAVEKLAALRGIQPIDAQRTASELFLESGEYNI